MFHGHLNYFQKPPLGGRPNTKPGDHGTPNAHNRWFILFYHVWGPAWIEIHWNSIWLRARSHMTSHYTWGSVTTLHDFGGVLGQPLDTFFWALTISWSQLLAHVWSDPLFTSVIETSMLSFFRFFLWPSVHSHYRGVKVSLYTCIRTTINLWLVSWAPVTIISPGLTILDTMHESDKLGLGWVLIGPFDHNAPSPPDFTNHQSFS